MLCAQWTYHVLPARLLVRFLLYHMFLARILVCSRLRFTCLLTLPFWTVDSSMLTILSYTYLLRTFVLVCRVSLHSLYIWLEMGIRPSSSIYFATTLQV